jgi:hypothetical protein
MFTYAFAVALFSKVTERPFAASLAATAIAFSAQHILHGGMEVLLTIPLALGLCRFRARPDFAWTVQNSVLYGLLAACVVLSRLDSVLFIGTLFLMEIACRDRADPLATPRLTLAGIIGALPIAAYAASNFLLFGSLAPISSRAKELRIHHAFTAVPVKWLLFSLSALPRLLVVVPTILLLALALGSLVTRGWKNLPSAYRPIAVALMTFPIIHILALSLTSDWPLFQWYIYSLLLAEVGAGLVLFAQGFELPKSFAPGFQAAAAVVLLAIMLPYAAVRLRDGKHPENQVLQIYNGSISIQRFSLTHPGIYAMGDRAGMPGYLLQYPVIQLEGLVMDANYLKNIQQERNLNQVLQNYGVTYLVATNPILEGGCYHVREPHQAGPDSRSMSGVFCQQPVEQVEYKGIVTDIFEVATPGSTASK